VTEPRAGLASISCTLARSSATNAPERSASPVGRRWIANSEEVGTASLGSRRS